MLSKIFNVRGGLNEKTFNGGVELIRYVIINSRRNRKSLQVVVRPRFCKNVEPLKF